MTTLCVVGVGYVGLVSSACFAEAGHKVYSLDIDIKKIEDLQQGIVPFFEPGLEQLVEKNISEGRLFFTTSYSTALESAKVIILAVDTPMGSDGSCNLSSIEKAALSIGNHINQDCVLVIKSTVPAGTHKRVESIIHEAVMKRDLSISIDVVSNPEFLREGCAIHDFTYPDRIILGVSSERAEEVMRSVYYPFHHNPEKFVIMDRASSELTKYASNTMLACRISFMNWLSLLAEKTGADIDLIRQGLGKDLRIGSSFLQAGVGYGGSCFPKDVKALINMAKTHGIQADLIEAIDHVNERQKSSFADKIITYFEDQGGIEGKTIAILGLSFKPETDDMREAPSLIICGKLFQSGAYLKLFDPVAHEKAKRLIHSSQAEFCMNEWQAIKGADAVVLLTEWQRFQTIDKKRLLEEMKGKAFFDGRNVFSKEEMQAIGFDYISVGRKALVSEQEKVLV